MASSLWADIHSKQDHSEMELRPTIGVDGARILGHNNINIRYHGMSLNLKVTDEGYVLGLEANSPYDKSKLSEADIDYLKHGYLWDHRDEIKIDPLVQNAQNFWANYSKQNPTADMYHGGPINAVSGPDPSRGFPAHAPPM